MIKLYAENISEVKLTIREFMHIVQGNPRNNEKSPRIGPWLSEYLFNILRVVE